MIEEYRFGLINIDGKSYNCDVEVGWNGEVLQWWRKEGHLVDIEDIKRAISKNPDVIVIGTGYSGMVEVTEKVQEFVRSKGIELILDVTAEAVKTFNIICQESEEEEGEEKRAIGLFHLTC